MGTGEGEGWGRQPPGPPAHLIPMKPAGFWVRTAAFLVDATLLLSILGIGLLVLILTPLKERFVETTYPALVLSPPLVVSAGLGMLAALLYFSFGESSPDKGTVGKKLLGLRVVDREGGRITLPRAAGRFLVKILSCAAFFTGVAMIGITRDKQALHDRVTDTLVMEAPVTNPWKKLGIGLAAVAVSLVMFLAVLGLFISFLWYSMQ
jgi:uncharacterized RDD family membrane protein YckC